MVKRLLLMALCLATVGGWAWASPVDTGRYTRTILDNGMVVIIYENHLMPWASVNIFVKSGGVWEDEQTEGLSHFSEHMFFRGTTSRTGMQLKQQIEGLGGETDAETTKDFTHFFVNLPSVHVPQMLELMADALINPGLDPKAIDVERQAVLDEYYMDLDAAMGVLQEKLFSLAYKTHPYRLPVIGTEENIKRFKQPDFIAWRHKYYVPERTALVIVGDVSTEQLMPQIHRLFGPFASTGIPVAPIPPEVPIAQTTEVTQPAPVHAGFAVIGYRAPPASNYSDVYACDLLSYMLGQGDDSLLNTSLVEHQHLAEMVSLDFLTQRDPGLIVLSMAASGPRLPAAKAAALRIVGDVQNDKFSDADLERARAMLIRQYELGNETDSGMADTLGFYEMIDRSSFALGYVDGVRHVRREDIVRVAKEYLGGPHLQILAVPRGMKPTGDTSDANMPKPSTTVK